MVIGAEACPAEVVDRWAPGRVMVNVYGPTETTMWASKSAPLVAGSGAPPIGSPVPGAALFVLDGWLRPVPAGVVGELYVAGARGGGWVLAPGRVDRVAVCGVSVRGRRGRGCIAPGIWCVGVLMGSCGIWGVPMSRSRSAGIASSSVRSQAALAAHPRVGQAVAVTHTATSTPSPVEGVGDKQLVGYVVLDQEMMLVREPAREAQLVEQWHGVYEGLYSGSTFTAGAPAVLGEDFGGWNSSYTGAPIPLGQMREWRAAAVDRILALRSAAGVGDRGGFGAVARAGGPGVCRVLGYGLLRADDPDTAGGGGCAVVG